MPALIVLQLLPEFDFLSQKHDINREPISVTSGVPSVGMYISIYVYDRKTSAFQQQMVSLVICFLLFAYTYFFTGHCLVACVSEHRSTDPDGLDLVLFCFFK